MLVWFANRLLYFSSHRITRSALCQHLAAAKSKQNPMYEHDVRYHKGTNNSLQLSHFPFPAQGCSRSDSTAPAGAAWKGFVGHKPFCPWILGCCPALSCSKSKNTWLQARSCPQLGSVQELLLLDNPVTPLWPFIPHPWRQPQREDAQYSRAALLLPIKEAEFIFINVVAILCSYKCKEERWEVHSMVQRGTCLGWCFSFLTTLVSMQLLQQYQTAHQPAQQKCCCSPLW